MTVRLARFARHVAALSISLGGALPAGAAQQTLTIDPAATQVDFELGATLHSADGNVKVKRGTIQFDPDTGTAGGEIVVDATSATTHLAIRDKNMHADVLESARFPTIVFRPERLVIAHRDASTAEVELHGVLDMHGQRHDLAMPAKLAAKDGRLLVDSKFRVPYVDWGMRDESTFVLRVDRFVTVTVHAEGALAAP